MLLVSKGHLKVDEVAMIRKKKDGIYNFWDLMGFNGILNGIGILPTSIFLLGGVLLSLLNPLISIDYYSVWNMNDFPFSWE